MDKNEENIKQLNTISKYDTIKIKIHIGVHWFIFSRYILAKTLNVINIDEKDCNKIAYELKKKLVNSQLFDVNLDEFQSILFNIMNDFGYKEVYKEKYIMMYKFNSNRFPFIILIAGTKCIGKSTLANYLSERLNISNVLQTKIVSIVMSNIDKKYDFSNIFTSDSIEENLKIYIEQSSLIRKGCNLDMLKAYKEGKAVILEGHHIIPDQFIITDENCDNNIKLNMPLLKDESKHDKDIRNEINSLNTRGLIIPFLFTINEKTHLKYFSQSKFKDTPNVYCNLRQIQKFLIKNNEESNSNFILIDVSDKKINEIINEMNTIVLNKIEVFIKSLNN